MHEYGGWTRHLSAYYSLHSSLKFNLQKYDAHALSYATQLQFTVLVLSHHRGTLFSFYIIIIQQEIRLKQTFLGNGRCKRNNENFPVFKSLFYGLGLHWQMDGNDERESKKLSSVKKNAGNLNRYHKNEGLEVRSIITYKFRKLNNKALIKAYSYVVLYALLSHIKL